MKKIIFTLLLTISTLNSYSQKEWQDLAVTEDMEIYIDSTSIKYIDGKIYAITKTIYTTQASKEAYVNKIRKVFKGKNAEKKIAKWDNFSYNITYGLYDCKNKRFKVMEIKDFRTDDSQVIKTKKKEKDAKWLSVDIDTVGDYVLFYICDYDSI